MKHEVQTNVATTGHVFSITQVETKTTTARVRRPIQRARIKELVDRGQLESVEEYLRTFAGRRRSNAYAARMLRTMGTDPLADKAPGSILKKLLARYDVVSDKRPSQTDLGEWIGVEIECVVPFEGLGLYSSDYEDEDGNLDTCDARSGGVERLREAFQRAKIKNAQVKYDGSINVDDSSEEFATEITVLFTRKDRSNLKAVCDLLNSLGARVNRSCGLHVHLDCRDLKDERGQMNLRRVTTRANRLGRALPVLAAMVPESRRSNSYCRLAVSRFDGGRYYAINKTAANKFGTIEVRLHSATTDFVKISNWIDLLFAISRATITERLETPDALIEASGIPDALAAYVFSRTALFSRTPQNNSDRDAQDASAA